AAVRVLEKKGARDIYASSTHPVLSGDAYERIEDSPLKELVVTNTIPLPQGKAKTKLKVLSVASLLGEAVRRIHENRSVSSLFL
ncbi:MAG: ribose-phosphate pyrophosphokinase, partial [Candidatus Aminicenantes bacterium]|nr:ribose-phosphate pyrophosphokinase [Candidatus Aminicenantes bacterium]